MISISMIQDILDAKRHLLTLLKGIQKSESYWGRRTEDIMSCSMF